MDIKTAGFYRTRDGREVELTGHDTRNWYGTLDGVSRVWDTQGQLFTDYKSGGDLVTFLYETRKEVEVRTAPADDSSLTRALALVNAALEKDIVRLSNPETGALLHVSGKLVIQPAPKTEVTIRLPATALPELTAWSLDKGWEISENGAPPC